MKYFSIIASFLVFLNCTNEKTVFDENHDEPLAMALSPELGFSFAKYTNSRKPSAGGHFVH